jgi:opacity protein-like surface antigen
MFKRILTLGLGILFSANALAVDEIIPINFPLQWSPIVTLSAGAAWATPGQNQYLYPLPPPSYQFYSYEANTQAAATLEVLFALQRVISPGIIGQFGIGLAGVSDYTINGSVVVNGVEDAYDYYYNINHARAELKGALIANTFKVLQPYISASFGFAYNTAHGYHPSANSIFVPVPLWYDSNVTLAFPYSVGAGVQATVNPNWQVGIGYQFVDLGKSFLNGDGLFIADNQKGLRQTHLYTNQLLVSVSYLFT